jgi:beta-glucosidase
MKTKTKLWRGLSAVMAFLLMVAIFASQVANQNAGGINNFLGITAANSTSTGTAEGEALYTSDYGELSDENLAKLIEDEMAYCVSQMEEGSVLLKNDGALPLQAEERSVTLFGRASADLRYRNTNGGGSADPDREINLKKAFNDAGFTINDTLYDAYAASATARVKSGDETEDIGEEDISFYTDSLKSTFSSYSDAAIVVLSRFGGESTDMSRNNVDGVPSLSLQPDEADLLQMINDSGVFDKIIVLINSVYPLELGWLDQYNVDACLWIGNPGYYGLPGVVNILTGDANPSGHLVDTYATDSLSSAAMQNFGEYRFSNGDGLPSYSNRYVVYAEGIYVGYKYYETRYEDAVLGQGNASGNAGIFASQGDSWNYADEMCYPFGYGLSYTTFSQTLESCDYDAATDTFTAKVNVTNTGDVAGKSVVQLYVQSPYTDYDQEHGVEKAAIQLVGFGKTQELEPGASETVEVTFERYLMASYDTSAHDGQGGYILDDGTYYFAIGENCHDALNNVLAAKGAQGMYDIDGTPVTGDVAQTATYQVESFDDQSYLVSVHTDAEVHNLFADADANYYYDDDPVTYLSRSDWQGTWSTGVELSSNDKLAAALETAQYDVSSSTTALDSVPYGVDAGLTLYDMIGVDYDDPQWTTFVQQLSLSDLGTLTSENYGQSAIESIGKPATVTSEGSEGISVKYLYGDGDIATGYASNTVVAATWNAELQYQHGNFYGEDALYAGVHTIHGPGADTHRTPYCGRFAEYFSEDSVISYNVGKTVNTAMSAKGLINNYKHFFMNDQEYDRQGIATFAQEQAMREIYLRAYEGGVTCEGSVGMMTSYNRIGTTYMAADAAAQISLLRDEWGYHGYTMTDYIAEGDYSVTADMVINGTDIFGGNDRSKSLQQLISRNKNGDLLLAAQESAHRILWAYVNSSMVNSLTPSATYTEFVAWWQYLLIGIQAALAVLTALMLILYIRSAYFKKN